MKGYNLFKKFLEIMLYTGWLLFLFTLILLILVKESML